MQYKTQYGTIFAVKEHNGAPAIMCRAEHSEAWSLSSMIEPYTPGAWTAEELQSCLDNWAATKDWKPVDESPACLCVNCTCTGCHEECYGHCHGCGHPVDHCNSYQTEGEKFLHQDKEDTTCNEEQPAPTGDAAATTDGSAAVSTAETTTTSESGADANSCETPAPAAQPSSEPPAELAPTAPSSLPAFDYGGLDDQTVRDLHLAEREVAGGKRMAEIGLRRMADGVAIAHDALCGGCDILSQPHNNQYSEKTFGRWCESVGLNRKAAERLLQVSKLFDNSTPREQKVLEELGPSLLYAAAKPSAPPELVQAVKDRDITTAKEFRELEAELKAERAAREKAEKDNDFLRADSAKARDAAHTYHRQYYEVAAQRNALIDQQGENIRLRIAAEKERDEALKQRDGARDENTSLKAQIRELEARPVEVAVAQPGEDQIEAWRKEGEARAAAALRESIRKADQARADAQRQVNALQDQLAAAVPDADACQRTADTLYETTENLRLLLRTQLRQAQLPPADYGSVVAHVLQAADGLRDTVRSCAPAGYTMDDEEDDFL